MDQACLDAQRQKRKRGADRDEGAQEQIQSGQRDGRNGGGLRTGSRRILTQTRESFLEMT